jgi:hypothetical protein
MEALIERVAGLDVHQGSVVGKRHLKLAITHTFFRRINALPATLKEAPLCTEPFGGRPLRVTFRAQT